jgi:DNA replication and repair protein RecF
MSEIELIKSEKSILPVLLLDDVLSELDKDRQDKLLASIGGIQTVITCTGVDVLNPEYFKNRTVKLFNVTGSGIKEY